MQEIIRLALSYLNGIWRYRWPALALAAVICPIGWAFVATLPDQYEASARVFVDTDSVLTPLLRGLAIEQNDNRRVYMMTNVLFSRENMEKLARMTDLDLRAKTPQDMDKLVADLKDRVSLKLEGNNIYDITFEDAKPDLAKRVVQSMLTMFVEGNLGDSRQDQDSAEQFLRREIKGYEQRLAEAERKLKDFKTRNFNVLSDKGSYYERLKSVNDDLNIAQQQLQFSVKRREGLSKELEQVEKEGKVLDQYQYDQSLGKSADDLTLPIEERVKQLQSQLDDLLLKYTDRHPDVIALRDSIARLKVKAETERKEFLAQKAAESSEGQPSSALADNPLYQQMRLRLSEAQADAAAQQSRVEDLTKQIANLQNAIDRGLKIETEQKQLNRDYEVIRKNYTELTGRLEQARLTRQADTSVDTVRFRILDPPKVPQKPTGPNRVAFSSAIFGAALIAGLGLALLLSQLRPVFGDRRELNETFGIPVLGSINMIWTEIQTKKRKVTNLAFAGGAVALLLAYGLVVTVFFLDLNPFAKMLV